jgi:geranylgeranyl diphosphate synthase type II
MELAGRYEEFRSWVNQRLTELLPSPSSPPELLSQAMRYAVLDGGKRIRPLLCLTSAEVAGGDPKEALDAACAVEIVHCFSLIHDDLPAMDDDALRRGKPTCHVLFGEAVALLAGDALLTLAFQVINQIPTSDAIRQRLSATLARGAMRMVRGQTVDVLTERQPFSEETLRWIHSFKTGALFGSACEMGAICVQAEEAYVERIASFGEILGHAFQIADDILDAMGASDLLGKGKFGDRERGKATYPALMGLEASRKECLRYLEEALGHLDVFGDRAEPLRNLARIVVSRI